MAILKPVLFAALSGNAAGAQFAQSTSRTILRSQSTKSRKQTLASITAQQLFAQRVQIYKSLPDSLKLAWRTYAERNPVPNRFGKPVYLPPLQCFLHNYPYPMQNQNTDWANPPQYGPTPTGLGINMQLDTTQEPAVYFAYPKVTPEYWTAIIYAVPRTPYRATSENIHALPINQARFRNSRIFAVSPDYIMDGLSWDNINSGWHSPQPNDTIAVGVKLWFLYSSPASTVWNIGTVQEP